MEEMIEAYPLHWPQGVSRTKSPAYARFKTSLKNARDGALDELRMLGAKTPIISSNVPLRLDGLPYASYSKITDCGVAIYFIYEGEQHVLACDRWASVEANMQAVRKTIEALRGLDRWGVSEMLKRVFTGFKALSGPENKRQWWEVLGCGPNDELHFIRNAYLKKVKEAHPDNGGTNEQFIEVQNAFEQAKNQTE